MNVPVILAVGAIAVVAVVMFMTREKDPQQRAVALQRTGAAVMAVFTVLAAIFIAGYALQDPGGNAGLLMTLAWVVPMLVLAVAAWFWPAPTAPLLLALASAFIAACVWLAFDPAALREFISENGPVIAVSVVALAFPAAVLGLQRDSPGRLAARGPGCVAAAHHDHRKVGRGFIARRGKRGSADRRDQLSCLRPDGERQHVAGESAGGRCLGTAGHLRVTGIGPAHAWRVASGP